MVLPANEAIVSQSVTQGKLADGRTSAIRIFLTFVRPSRKIDRSDFDGTSELETQKNSSITPVPNIKMDVFPGTNTWLTSVLVLTLERS